MYRCAKGTLSKREEKLIAQYLESQQLLDEKLAREYQSLLDQLDAGSSKYLTLIARAFVPDPELALLGSVKLALELGVPTEDILDSEDKIAAFFIA